MLGILDINAAIDTTTLLLSCRQKRMPKSLLPQSIFWDRTSDKMNMEGENNEIFQTTRQRSCRGILFGQFSRSPENPGNPVWHGNGSAGIVGVYCSWLFIHPRSCSHTNTVPNSNSRISFAREYKP